MLNLPSWLSAPARPSPFLAGENSRHLCFIVMDDDLEPTPALDLLRTLSNRRPLLDVVSPTGAYGGRITIAEDQKSIDYEFKDRSGLRVFVYGDWWRQAASEQGAESGLDAVILERRFLLAHEAGRRDWVDGLVMPFSPQAAQRWRNLLIRAPLLEDEQALALAGLFLRAHGDFTIEVDHAGTTFHAGHAQMYRIGASALLPGIACWLVASQERWRSTGEPALYGLADAVLVRFARALRARDYLHVRLRAPHRQAAWPDVLFFFESVLVSLQGSLDAAARFLHLEYDLLGPRKRANWGTEQWREKLEASAAPTSSFDGASLWDLDALVGDLRNSIHGEVLSDELRQTTAPGDDPVIMGYARNGIVLEPELAERVADAARRQGDTTRWLRQTFPSGAALVNPWEYAEAAVEATARSVASVIAAVNTESFQAIAVDPRFEELWVGSPPRRRNALLLFGVGVLPRMP
jgi:hypothetical protein